MALFSLIWAALWRRKARTVFTLLSVVVAFMLFSLLAAIRQGLVGQLRDVSASRLNTDNKVSQGHKLPMSYYDKIAQVPGVAAVSALRLFHGYFREPGNTVNVIAAQPGPLLQVFPDLRLTPAEMQRFLGDRQGAMAGPELARRLGWKVGDDIPIQSDLRRTDGQTAWHFHLDAIYKTDLPAFDQHYFVVHYDYINEALPAGQRNRVGQFVERVADPRQAAAISAAIDALFAAGPVQTLTQTQQAETLAYIRQFGDVSAMVLAVGTIIFFTLLLIVSNTLYQSVQERLTEFAVLKALGFRSTHVLLLVFGEALLLNVGGAALGLFLGYGITRAVRPTLETILQAFGLTFAAVLAGVLIAVAFGLLAACLPLPRVLGGRVLDTLRGV
ncbi:MAG: ABC transporter permease [Gammaproteobacteria bacterium]|nr:ABC transporter permease [Gammaproteobacteria bacterium]